MRLLPLAAALVVLTGCTGAPESGGGARGAGEAGSSGRLAAGSPAAGTTAIDGVAAVDRGVVAWEDGVVLDDPQVLRVMATGLDGPPTPCQVATVVKAVRQTDTEVVVEARQYEMADKPEDYACPAIAQGPQPHELRLDEPLAGRTVVDAESGASREVIAFDDFPTVQQVPAGYVWRPPTWDDERRVVTRSWGSMEGTLTLETGPGNQLSPLPAVLKQGRIQGEPFTVTRVIMLSCARWGPPNRTLNLCSRDDMAGDPPLNPDQLLAVAETVG
jgi:hypothetical protein